MTTETTADPAIWMRRTPDGTLFIVPGTTFRLLRGERAPYVPPCPTEAHLHDAGFVRCDAPLTEGAVRWLYFQWKQEGGDA